MARNISVATQTALDQRNLIARDFIWFEVRDRATGATVTDGYWSDLGTRSFQVIDPDTLAPVTRSYAGGAGLIGIPDIPLVSNLTVQTITVTLSQLSDRVNALIRLYDPKQGRVEIHRGMFDRNTRLPVGPAEVRFVGFIDGTPVETPKEGEIGDVQVTVVGHAQEWMRANPDTRNDESQKLRTPEGEPADEFMKDVSVVGDWELFWGKANGKIPAGKPKVQVPVTPDPPVTQ
jgi:hypothetical protein